jgi:hypothetical protein
VVPASSFQELVVCKAHNDSLIGHFRVATTFDVLHKHFYWLKMKMDVQRIYEQCIIACGKEK